MFSVWRSHNNGLKGPPGLDSEIPKTCIEWANYDTDKRYCSTALATFGTCVGIVHNSGQSNVPGLAAVRTQQCGHAAFRKRAKYDLHSGRRRIIKPCSPEDYILRPLFYWQALRVIHFYSPCHPFQQPTLRCPGSAQSSYDQNSPSHAGCQKLHHQSRA